MNAQTDILSEATNGVLSVVRVGAEKDLGDQGFFAPATITAVRIKDPFSSETSFTGLIDTGCHGEGDELAELLRSQGIFPGRVNEIYLTHNHPDHSGNLHLFPNARVVGPDSIYSTNKPNYFRLLPSDAMDKPGVELTKTGIPGFDRASIVSTPGHAGQDLSILYPGPNGLVAVVGDLFWSQHDWENDSAFLNLCASPDMQRRSRDYVRALKPAVVVPGHGPAFAPKY